MSRSKSVPHPSPDQRTAAADGSFLRLVGRTGSVNLATALSAAVNGVLLARLLGPSGRGDYAAVTSLFGITLVVFEAGLGSSVVYNVSHRPRERTPAVLGTALTLLLPLALTASALVLIVAKTTPSAERSAAITLLPFAVFASFLGAPATFALQSLSLASWNISRAIQPALFLIVTAGVLLTNTSPSAAEVVGLFTLTIVAQNLAAWALVSRMNLGRPETDSGLRRPLLIFGLQNLLSTAPNAMNARLDQLIMAYLVSPAALGQYAVAVSLSLMASPLVTAFGNVLFPSLASGRQSSASIRAALRQAALTAAVGAVLVCAIAPVAVPYLYGKGFIGVVSLLIPLAIGGCFMSLNQVLGDVLRGAGQPRAVAKCEWLGAVATVALVPPAVLAWGTLGAALLSLAVYAAVFFLLLRETTRHLKKEDNP